MADAGEMMATRKVVTADVSGRSAVISDSSVKTTMLGEVGVDEVWRADAAGRAASLDEQWDLNPPSGGHVFRITTFPPAAPGEEPWMHRSDTIDYALILEGKLTLVTDGGETLLHPNDVVVQQGANHGWINRTDRPARMAVILVEVSHS